MTLFAVVATNMWNVATSQNVSNLNSADIEAMAQWTGEDFLEPPTTSGHAGSVMLYSDPPVFTVIDEDIYIRLECTMTTLTTEEQCTPGSSVLSFFGRN